MRSRFASFAACAAIAVAAVGPLAAPAAAVEPYDSRLLAVLAAPGPEFVEITDPADPGHSGPLDAARMDALDITLPESSRATILGAAVRGDASATNRLLQVAYELADGAHARSSIETLPAIGAPFDVQGIPGAVGRSVDTPAVAYVAFVLGNRSFFLVLGGADPGNALLQDTALQVVNAAAENLTGGLAADMGGGSLDDTSTTGAATTGGGLRATVQDALGHDDVRLALAAVAALLLYVVASRNRPAPKRAATAPLLRSNSQAWRQQQWGGTANATEPAPAPTVLGGPVTGIDAVGADVSWPGGDVGWGDDDASPLSFPPPVTRMRDRDPEVAPPETAAAWAAPSPAPSPAVPVAADEEYSFPGAERWPEGPAPAP